MQPTLSCFYQEKDDPELGKTIYKSPVPSKLLLYRFSFMIDDKIAVFTFYGFLMNNIRCFKRQ